MELRDDGRGPVAITFLSILVRNRKRVHTRLRPRAGVEGLPPLGRGPAEGTAHEGDRLVVMVVLLFLVVVVVVVAVAVVAAVAVAVVVVSNNLDE